MDWKKEWTGKQIFVKLKNGSVYSGKVIEVENISGAIYVHIHDKFGIPVSFLNSEIIRIKEEGI